MRSIGYEPEENEDVVRVLPASANATATGNRRRKITLRTVIKAYIVFIIIAAITVFGLFGCYTVKMSSARKDLNRADIYAAAGYTEDALQYFRTALDKGRDAIHVEKAALTVMKATPLFPLAIKVDREADEALANIVYCEEEVRRLFPDIDF